MSTRATRPWRYTNYTTTASYVTALTVRETTTHLLLVNDTGESVDITFDNQNDTRIVLIAGATLQLDEVEINANVRARYSSGGSGAAGLHITVW